MKTYKITGPDGKEYTIDGPEGATREQVIQKIQERLATGSRSPAPVEQTTTQSPAPVSQNTRLADRLLNSPLGGFVRGLRDIPDAGAQLMTRGLEAIAPPGLQEWARGQREKVENINKQAEQDYKQNWRGGGLSGIDWGRMGGQIAGTLPLAAIPVLNPTTVGGAAKFGAVTAPLSQPVYNDDFAQEKALQSFLGASGGAIGAGIGKGVGNLLQPVVKETGQTAKIAGEAAKRLGVKNLTPGQKTGSTALQQVEAVLTNTPGSAGKMGLIWDSQKQALNRAAARSIGESTDDLSEYMFTAARDRLGKAFNDLAQKTSVDLGDDFVNALAKIQSKNASMKSFADKKIDKLVKQGLDLAATGKLSGPTYQTLRSQLTKRAQGAFSRGQNEVADALRVVRDGLDKAARANLDDVSKSAWDTVRKQYANLKVLEKGNVVADGNINPNLVGNALKKYNPGAFKRGNLSPELMDIYRFHRQYGNKIPSSGTSERSLVQNMLFGNPLTGLPMVATARGVQELMFSPLGQYYLTHGIVPLGQGIKHGLTALGGVGGARAAQGE